MIDDHNRLTFYRLQAHFFSENAEVIHGRLAVPVFTVRGQFRGRRREDETHGNRVRRASVMPNPARRMGVSPTLGLTTEPVNALIGDCCGLSESAAPPAGPMIPALTPCTTISSRSRLASYPSMVLSSWIPCGTMIRDNDSPRQT